MTETRRDPHIGHFNIASKLVSGNAPPLVQISVWSRISEMMKMARELAGRGHRPQMIEATLTASGFPEAPEFIDQLHIRRELKDIAERARRPEERQGSIREN